MTPDPSAVRADRRGFFRAVGVIVGGTAVGHLLSAVALPIATRLYSPADFNVLAVFSSLLAIISVAACLRYDVAVPMPETDEDAASVLAVAVVCAVLSSLAVALVVLLLPQQVAGLLRQPALSPFLWLLPPAVLMVSCYSALQGWFVRTKSFGTLARARVGQSAASASVQIGMGAGGFGVVGLLIANALYSGGASIVLTWRMWRSHRAAVRSISLRRMRVLAHQYERFPKYSTLEALANSAAIQLPVILIAALALGPDAGHLILAMQVMQAPMAIVGGAIGQVYLSQAPDQHRAGRLGEFTSKIGQSLIRAGVGPLVFAGIVAPAAFPALFGAEWERAGWLVSWMTPWFVMQFLASPISMALHVTGHQRTALGLQLAGLVLRVGAVLLTARFANAYIVEVYALSGFIVYFVYLLLILRASGTHGVALLHGLRRTLTISAGWIVLALLCIPTIRIGMSAFAALRQS